MDNRKFKRKTFAAREDLIKRASAVAKTKGFSFYAYANEILQVALQAEELGISLQTLIEERELLKAAKETGFILGLESLWYEMADISYKKAKRRSLKCWNEAGTWLAKRYLSSVVKDPFSVFKQDLEDFIWNASEIVIKSENDEISIRIISPRFSESYTFLLIAFLEGALHSFGYTIFNKDVSRGTIRITANRGKC